jgi:glutaredoxin-like protein NrdH
MDNVPTVYGKPGCVQCQYTTKLLDTEGVPYNYVDITVNEIAHQEVKNLGFLGVPVVVTDSGSWAGFNPDRIRKING